MSDEQKVPNVNVEAEQDVQNTLAELKGEAQAPADGAAPAKTEETEEARIVEAASKLGKGKVNTISQFWGEFLDKG